MEEHAQQSSDTTYVVIPKKEIDEELEITFEKECQDDQLIVPKVEFGDELSDNFDELDDINPSNPMKRERMLSEEFIIPKEEIITDQLLDDYDSEHHDDSLIKPIKVELMLSEEIVNIRQKDSEVEKKTDLTQTSKSSDKRQSIAERTSHPSRAQVECLLEFFERNPSLAKGFSKVPSARDAARKSWETLTLHLNSMDGCVKTWKRWTKYWADKKSAVKKKSALRYRARNKSGGGEIAELSSIEEKILTLMGGESFANAGHRHSGINTFETTTSRPATRDSVTSIAPKIIADAPVSEISPSPTPMAPSEPCASTRMSVSESPPLPSSPSGSDVYPRRNQQPSPILTPSSCRNRRRERLAPFERRSQFARISERLLAIEEQRVEIDRRNTQLLEAYTSRSQERDSALAQALLAIGDGLKLLADAVKK